MPRTHRQWASITLGIALVFGGSRASTHARESAGEGPELQLNRLRALHRASQPDSVRILASRWRTSPPFDQPGEARRELLSTWGIVEASFGRGRFAEPLLREALQLSDQTESADLLRWIGVSLGLQGRVSEADSIYTELLALAVDSHRVDLEGWGHVGRGWCALQRGQLQSCVEENRRARDCFREAGLAIGYSWAMNTEAIALRRLGSFERARSLYLEAIESSGSMQGATMLNAMALSNLGNLDMILGDPSEAVRSFRRAEYIHLQHRHEREVAVARLDRCVALIQLSREDEGLAGLDSLRTHCIEHGWSDLQARATNEIAHVLEGRNREEEALNLYAAIASSEDLPFRAREDAASGRRALLLRRGEADAVLDDLSRLDPVAEPAAMSRRAITQSQALRASGRADEAHATILAWLEPDSLSQLGEAQALDVLVEVARAARAANEVVAQLRALEMAASRWEDFRAQPSDPLWREQRAAWASAIYPLLAECTLENGREPVDVRPLFERVQAAKARTLIERMEGPRSSNSVPDSGPIVLSLLHKDEVFLDLYLGEETGVLFRVDRDSVVARIVPGAAYWRPRLIRLEKLRRQNADLGAVRSRLGSQLLGEPRERRTKGQTVFWCPDGPFLSSAGLIEPGWTIIPSWALLSRIRARSGEVKGGVCAWVVGDDGSPALPHARSEQKWLSRNFTSVASTRSELWPSSSPVAALHFAGHVNVDTRTPWNTRLCVVRDGRTRQDWPAWKIARTRNAPALVVLSGCATVAGRELPGEGLSGLAAAFLSAGSRCVIATRWPVEDRFAERFMRSFYGALQAGEAVGRALARARSENRSSADQPDAFVLLGDPDLRLRLR